MSELAPVTPVQAGAGSPLREYIDQAGDLPNDVLLGRIVLYTISDEPVPHSTLERWFNELGLDKAFLPNPLRELDAFKKATSDINGRSYAISGDRTAHLLCRDVSSNSEVVIRQITREIRDARKKRLSYDVAVTARYYRKTHAAGHGVLRLKVNAENPTGDHLLTEEVPHVRAFAHEVTQAFGTYCQNHDGQKMRALVRNYLLHLNAIEIKNSTYFIHASRDAELSALAELVNRLGGRSEMNMLPIVDLGRERKFITAVFEREASESLSRIADEIKTLMSSGKVTAGALKRMKAQYDDVLLKAQEHMARLEVTQDVTATAAEHTHNLLTQLQQKVANEA